MTIRDRIKELRRVPARELRAHPRNWRTHPRSQRAALEGVLADVGYAAALVARELDDGSLELIDGHLRAETTPDQIVPVLVLDVSESEARKLLASLDPLVALAERDESRLSELLADLETESEALRGLWDELIPRQPNAANADDDVEWTEAFQVVVECRDEAEQKLVFERLHTEGFTCRAVTL